MAAGIIKTSSVFGPIFGSAYQPCPRIQLANNFEVFAARAYCTITSTYASSCGAVFKLSYSCAKANTIAQPPFGWGRSSKVHSGWYSQIPTWSAPRSRAVCFADRIQSSADFRIFSSGISTNGIATGSSRNLRARLRRSLSLSRL